MCVLYYIKNSLLELTVYFFMFLQLHLYKAVGDLSSSAQDLHQEPGTIQVQPAAGPEGLFSEVCISTTTSQLKTMLHNVKRISDMSRDTSTLGRK